MSSKPSDFVPLTKEEIKKFLAVGGKPSACYPPTEKDREMERSSIPSGVK